MLSTGGFCSCEIVQPVGGVVVEAIVSEESVLRESPALVDSVVVLGVELDRLIRQELIGVGVSSRGRFAAGEGASLVSQLIGRAIVDVPLEVRLTIIATELVMADDRSEAKLVLGRKLNVDSGMCIGDLCVVTTPAITGRILHVGTCTRLAGDRTCPTSSDTMRAVRADGVACVEGWTGLRLLIDDVDDTAESGVTYAHRGSTLEYFDVVYRCHPRKRC